MRLFITLLLINFSVSAQNDSLQHLVNASTAQDTTYVKRLLQLSDAYKNSNIDEQLKWLEEAYQVSKSKQFQQLQAQSALDLARAYRKKGVYDSAVASAQQAKRIYDTLPVKQDKLLVNSVLAMIYRDEGYHDEALKLNLDNVNLIQNDTISPSLGRYYFDLGTTYRALDSLEKAEANYITSLEIAQNTGFRPGEIFMKLSLGQLYKVMDQYDKAEAYLKDVLPVYQSQNNQANIALIHYDLATIQSLRGNHKASIPLYETALEIYSDLGRLQFIKDINQKLFIAYNIIEDLPKAQLANAQYNLYKDSIDSQERKALVAEMKTKFETEQVEAENALNQKRAELAEAESQRNLGYLIGSIVVIGLLILIFVFYSAKQKQAKKTALIQQELKASQQKLALEKQYRDSELKALKAQMNPHFIFNVLNSIQEFIVLNQKELASEYLATFADLIRSYLHFSNKGQLTLEEEIETLEKYLELEQLRFSQNFEYTINVGSNINPECIEIPTMLIQPYVENAVKHGLFHKQGSCVLKLSFEKENEQLLKCTIEDNGIGRSKAQALKQKKNKLISKSFANEATASRLNLLNEQTSEKIGVEIIDLTEHNQPSGTRVELRIPIKS